MKIVRDDGHRDHHVAELDGGEIIPSWEHPGRADIVDEVLDAGGPTAHEFVAPDELDRGLVERVHDGGYVSFLETAWGEWIASGNTAESAMPYTWPTRRLRAVPPTTIQGRLGYYSFAADCSIGPATWRAVTASAATAQTAADLVLGGDRVVFARCRPPGHHAATDQFGGYCYLNNAAIAAQRLRDRGHQRVAILDVDYHHGNGTQEIFWERDDVVFGSIHADPMVEFPYFLGHADEVGDGAGAGANHNVPLPHGTEADRWFTELDGLVKRITPTAPTALVVSLGVDTFHEDPISKFRMESHDFDELGRRLETIGLPTVIVMEGGYATAALGDNIGRVISGFERQLAT